MLWFPPLPISYTDQKCLAVWLYKISLAYELLLSKEPPHDYGNVGQENDLIICAVCAGLIGIPTFLPMAPLCLILWLHPLMGYCSSSP